MFGLAGIDGTVVETERPTEIYENGVNEESSVPSGDIAEPHELNLRGNNMTVSENRAYYNTKGTSIAEPAVIVSIKKTNFRYKMPAVYYSI